MNTPIYDFLKQYALESPLRLHMPGHKGLPHLGIESLDLTEVSGADSLYEASGIIGESEENASSLFGCPTYFATEGSSQCIRAMLYLANIHAPTPLGTRPRILAGRNAHKTFLSAVALLDMDVAWLYGCGESYLSCMVTPDEVEKAIQEADIKPLAVYLTSPDYLGNMADIAGIAEVCHRHGVLLLVDNAHGAYLKFLPHSLHPMDLGADICCDSAHKTLPVLTGGAYLHVSAKLTGIDRGIVKQAMALFGSTSPSYLILASLDMANAYLSGGYGAKLSDFIPYIEDIKKALAQGGYTLIGNEPLKITLGTKSYGYSGSQVADILHEGGMVCEFADPDHVVLMLTPDMRTEDLRKVKKCLLAIPRGLPILTPPPQTNKGVVVMTPRQALLSPTEEINVSDALGRVLGAPTVGCPPAVPIVVSGEVIDEGAVASFHYYGITTCRVVKNH